MQYNVTVSLSGSGQDYTGAFNVKKYGATGDGVTDDTSAIQDAANDAQTAGAALYFPPTVSGYVCEKIDIITGGIKIYGDNTLIIHQYDAIVQGAGGLGTTKAWPVFMIYNGANDVEITGFRFTDDATITAAMVILNDDYHSMLSPIVVNRADNIWVHDNIFANDGPRGVFQYGGNYMNLRDNYFDGVGIGVHVGWEQNTNFWDAGPDDNTTWYSPVGTTIHNNKIVGYDNAQVHCLFTSGLQKFTITDNTVDAMDEGTRHGILVYVNDYGVTDINGVPTTEQYGNVSGNNVSGTFHTGIKVVGVSSSTIVEHNLHITFDGNTVTGDATSDGTGAGIGMDSSPCARYTDNHVVVDGAALYCTRYMSDAIFSGNHFESTAPGISSVKSTVVFGSTFSASNAKFKNNTFVTDAVQTHCFYTHGVTLFKDITIDKNTFNFYGATGVPYVIEDDASTGVLRLTGNHYALYSASLADKPYLAMSGPGNVEYVGNVLSSATHDPRPAEFSCGGLVFTENITEGLLANVAGTCVVKGNTLKHESSEATATLEFQTGSYRVVCSDNDVENTVTGQPVIHSSGVDVGIFNDNTVRGNYPAGLIRFDTGSHATAKNNLMDNSGSGGDSYYIMDSSTLVAEITGSGDPNNVETASVASVYRRTGGGSNTSLYIKESGTTTSTGWQNK